MLEFSFSHYDSFKLSCSYWLPYLNTVIVVALVDVSSLLWTISVFFYAFLCNGAYYHHPFLPLPTFPFHFFKASHYYFISLTHFLPSMTLEIESCKAQWYTPLYENEQNERENSNGDYYVVAAAVVVFYCQNKTLLKFKIHFSSCLSLELDLIQSSHHHLRS